MSCPSSYLQRYQTTYEYVKNERPKCSELVRPRAETLRYPTSLSFGEGVEIFSLYGCEKILTHSRLPGQVIFGWLQSIRRWRAICLLCSDPIPPVAVAADQPAKNVLSRSARRHALSDGFAFVGFKAGQ